MNSGKALIIFKTRHLSHKYRDPAHFKERISREGSSFQGFMERNGGKVKDVQVYKAYLEGDIIWDNLGASKGMAQFKRVSFFLAIVLVSVTLLTPTYAVNMLDPLKYTLDKMVFHISFMTKFIATYFSALIIIFINFVIIPFLVDLAVVFEDH